jgi:hypothetical protein
MKRDTIDRPARSTRRKHDDPASVADRRVAAERYR